jgi:hypothetical protein
MIRTSLCGVLAVCVTFLATTASFESIAQIEVSVEPDLYGEARDVCWQPPATLWLTSDGFTLQPLGRSAVRLIDVPGGAVWERLQRLLNDREGWAPSDLPQCGLLIRVSDSVPFERVVRAIDVALSAGIGGPVSLGSDLIAGRASLPAHDAGRSRAASGGAPRLRWLGGARGAKAAAANHRRRAQAVARSGRLPVGR